MSITLVRFGNHLRNANSIESEDNRQRATRRNGRLMLGTSGRKEGREKGGTDVTAEKGYKSLSRGRQAGRQAGRREPTRVHLADKRAAAAAALIFKGVSCLGESIKLVDRAMDALPPFPGAATALLLSPPFLPSSFLWQATAAPLINLPLSGTVDRVIRRSGHLRSPPIAVTGGNALDATRCVRL